MSILTFSFFKTSQVMFWLVLGMTLTISVGKEAITGYTNPVEEFTRSNSGNEQRFMKGSEPPKIEDPRTFGVPTIDGPGHYDVSKDIAGDFGLQDFTISMDITGKGGGRVSAIGKWDNGVIFIRSTQKDYPVAGPMANLGDNGKIVFRITGPGNGGWEIPFPNPSDAITRHVVFARRGNVLSAQVDDKLFEHIITNQINVKSIVTEAPLRFGGNHLDPKLQSLNVIMENITWSPTTVFKMSLCP